MTKYVGCPCNNPYQIARVEADDRTWRNLDWRLDLANHSPTGPNWGYEGSGPAQCALAILADALEDDQRALRLYQKFKRAVVSKWKNGEHFIIPLERVREIADSLEVH